MMTFRRVSTTRLYVPAAFATDPSQARGGLVLDAPVATEVTWPTNLPQAIVAFWAPLSISFDTFLARLPGSLAALPAGSVRFAFFSPDGTLSSSLQVPSSGSLAATFGLDLEGTRYRLQLAKGSVAEATPQGIRFRKVTGSHALTLVEELENGGDGDSWNLNIDGDISVAFEGPRRGCLSFRLKISGPKLAALGGQLRFFEVGEADEGLQPLDAKRYPLFRLDAQILEMDASLDPLDPFDLDRNELHFIEGTQVASHYEVVTGHQVGLRATQDSRLVLERSVREIGPDREITFQYAYLCPAGSFELCVDADPASETQSLVLGASASDYVKFRPRRDDASGDLIVFHPRQPATDRSAFGASSAGFDEPEGARKTLGGLAATSWISFAPAASAGLAGRPAPALVSQPAEFEFFTDRAMAGLAEGPRQMPFDERSRADAAATPMPAVPILGVSAAVANGHGRFEKELIAAARQEEIRPKPTASLVEVLEERATPHGFPVTLAGDSWRKLVLARTPKSGEIAFTEMGHDFTRALSGNQTFLVATRFGEGLARLTEQLDIAGWGFNAGIMPPESAQPLALSGRMPSVFVLKYHERSFFDLLGLDPDTGEVLPGRENSGGWSEAEKFNASWIDVRDNLRGFLKDTFARHQSLGKASPFDLLIARLKNPGWNGVLFFNAEVLTKILPKQVQGLLGGINTEFFRAHHLGIELNRLGQSGFGLEHSALFGVAEYPLPATGSSGSFDPKEDADVLEVDGEGKIANFRVDFLRIQFENSEVRRFECRVSVWLEKLFGESTLGASTGKAIAFDGKYERRLEPGGGEVETYTFVHEGQHELIFDTNVLQKLTIRKLQLTTVDATDERIVTRFTFWGGLEFQKIESLDLFSLNGIEFADLGIDLDFDPIEGFKRFLPSLGSLKFNLPEGGKRATGLLGQLPFRLKFFKFGKGLSLPKLGYFNFGNGFGGDFFDFGLGFELDLGSLGSLAKKLGGLKLEALLGWLPKAESDGDKPRFAFGFKLSGTGGGALDLGIEGVLKLVIEQLKIEEFEHESKKMLAIQAVNTRLEVLGKKFPEDSKLKLFLFVDPTQAAQGKISEMGWLGVLTKNASGGDGFKLPLLALGQRVNAYPVGGVPSTREVTDYIKNKIGQLDSAGQLGSLIKNGSLRFAPQRDWTIALQTVLWELADLDLVFLDPDLYGVRLRVPGNGASPQLFAIDVLYRKISDDLGEYSIELAVPDAWRQIDFGCVSLTLPVIGLDLYTNGDFQVDIGFPWNLDFSRSCQVQVLPFLGAGGFYFAKLSGASSHLVPTPRNERFTYDPVVHVGFAARFGMGKDFRKGVLRAGVSVSAFCTLEGAWGQRRLTDKAGSGPEPPEHYLRVAGTIGVLGEVYGYVDFGIVKAGIAIRVWVAVGWVLETFRPLLLSVEAGVQVRVEVVIGRFKIFGRTFQITISFSFSTRLHFEFTLGKGDIDRWDRTFHPRVAGLGLVGAAESGTAAALVAPRPDLGPGVCLDWSGVPALFAAPQEVSLHFAADVTVANDRPATVALLTAEAGQLAVLGRALVRWAAGEWQRAVQPVDSALDPLDRDFSADELRHLEACLSLPRSLARGDSGPDGVTFTPLDAVALRDFFVKNLRFHIAEPPEQATGEKAMEAAVFPFFAELVLRYSLGASLLEKVELDATSVDLGYLDQLDQRFEKLRILLAERERSAAAVAPPAKPLADFLLEDYCHLVLRQAVDALEGALTDLSQDDDPSLEPTRRTLDELLTQLDGGQTDRGWDQIGAAASRFYLHGLRLPDPDTGADRGLFELAGQQRPLEAATGVPLPTAGDYSIALAKKGSASWLAVPEDTAIKIDLDKAQNLPATVAAKLHSTERRSPIRERSRRYPLQEPVDWSLGGAGKTLWTLPSALREHSRNPLALAVFRGKEGKIGAEPLADALETRWATQIVLRIERLADAGDRPVYRLLPLGEVERRLIDRLVRNIDWLLTTEPHILFKAGTFGVDSRPAAVAEIWRSDLSTEPRAETGIAPTQLLVRAGLGDLPSFLELVRRAALVRSDGYFLSYQAGGQGLPAEIFDQQGLGEIALLLLHRRDPAAALSSFANRVLLPADESAQKSPLTYARAADESLDRERDLPFAPGTVGFRAYRRNPGDTIDAQFHLLDYEIWDGGQKLTEVAEILPISPRDVGEPQEGEEPRRRPADLAPTDWCYEHILPAHKLISDADASGSPYSAVGKELEIRFRFRDPYGNRLAEEASQSLSLPVRYTDRLLSPTNWPSMVSSYDVVEEAGAGKLRVELRFDPRGFFDLKKKRWLDPTATDSDGREAAERIEDVRRLYRTLRFQLQDVRTELRISSSLHEGASFELDGADRQGLIALVDQIDLYLAGLPVSGEALPADPLAVPGPRWHKVILVKPEAALLTDLALSFELQRPLELIARELFAGQSLLERDLLVAEVFRVSAPVPAALAVADDSSGLMAFADRFESAFPGLALATGVGEQGNRSLWSVRKSLAALQPAAGPATFFAVPPLSTRLLAGQVETAGFGPSLPAASLRVADVDLDVHLRSFLRDVETFLRPAFTDRVRQLAPGELDRVLRAKDDLAEAGSSRLLPVFADPSLSPAIDEKQRATKLLRERMATDLREGYDIDTLVLVPMKNSGGSSAPKPPVAFGRLVDPAPDLRRLSPANIDLAAGESWLAFVLDSKRETRHAFEELDGLVYRLTHIERRIDSAEHFRDTAWLQLLKPVEVPLPAMRVPVPVREFPAPPVIEEHRIETSAIGPGSFEDRVRQARDWTYRADFAHPLVDQDTVYLEILYNSLPPAGSAGLTGGNTPFEALVAYHHFRAPLWATFGQIAGDAQASLAGDHLGAFASLVEAVTASLASGPAAGLVELEKKRELYRIDDDPVGTGISRLTMVRELDAFGGRFEVVQRDRGGAEIEKLTLTDSPAGSATRVITYRPPADFDRYRPRVRRHDLDVLQAENAWGALILRRNVALVPDVATTEAFHYEAPAVRFGEPLTPLLDHPQAFELDGPPDTLKNQVARILAQVVGESGARVELRWGYESGVLARSLNRDPHDFRAPHPIAYLPAFSLKEAGGLDHAAQSQADLLADWLARNPPVAQAHLVADLRVYGRQVEKPVLRLRRVILPIAKIKK